MPKGRYQKILVPLDGSGWSERAITHACEIARTNESHLLLLHVFRSPAQDYADSLTLSGQDGQIDHLRDQAEQQLIALRNNLRAEGFAAEGVLMQSTADVPSCILSYVREEGIDLIVMSSHGRTGLARVLFGSVAYEVLQQANIPVMVIKPDAE